jgi:hypothetical protein
MGGLQNCIKATRKTKIEEKAEGVVVRSRRKRNIPTLQIAWGAKGETRFPDFLDERDGLGANRHPPSAMVGSPSEYTSMLKRASAWVTGFQCCWRDRTYAALEDWMSLVLEEVRLTAGSNGSTPAICSGV